jgi:hypothetical protein
MKGRRVSITAGVAWEFIPESDFMRDFTVPEGERWRKG